MPDLDHLSPYRAASRRIRALNAQLARQFRDRSTPGGRPVPRLRSSAVQDDLANRGLYKSPVELAELVHEGQELIQLKQRRALQAVWRRQVGPAPDCRPGDPDTNRLRAAEYAARLTEVLDRSLNAEYLDDGTAPLTRSEMAYLRRQIEKWKQRAAGMDPRFEKYGTKGGRAAMVRVWR